MRREQPGRLGRPPATPTATTIPVRENGSGHPPPTTGRRDRIGLGLRVSGAGLILVSGVVHFQLWLGVYSALPVIGPLFLLNACSALVLAVTVVSARGLSVTLGRWWIEPLADVAGCGFVALTLAAFLLSATRGLFGFQDSLRGGPQEIAGVAEAFTLIVLGWALTRCVLSRTRQAATRREQPN
ncbi:MAG: hypothetical protein ACRDN9_11510 [Streptosporangiaceae bacterium]